MEFDSESCILKDQFTQPQIDQFLASVAQSPKVSPWVDCGFTYRGKMSEAEIFDKDKGSSQQLTCRQWNDKRPPTINFEVNQRGNFCHFPDYQQTGQQCGQEQKPWCYVEEGVEQYDRFGNDGVKTKYGVCQIKDCKCGTTGLYHINFYSEKTQAGFQTDVIAANNLIG